MKHIKRNNVIGGLFVTLFIFLAASFNACAEEERSLSPAPDPNAAVALLVRATEDLKTLKDGVQYGKKKDQYPEESRQILENAMSSLGKLVLEIHYGTKNTSESEATAFVNSVKLPAVTAFNATKRTEDVPYESFPAELYVDGGKGGYIDFGTHSEYVNFGTFGNQKFTIEFQAKVIAPNGGGAFLSTARNGGSPMVWQGWEVRRDGDHKLHTLIGAAPSAGVGNDRKDILPEYRYDNIFTGDNLSKWQHLAVVIEDIPGKVRFTYYVDGVKKGESNGGKDDATYNAASNGLVPMTGFRRPNGGDQLAGYMKYFRIWKSAKTATEISELKNGKPVSGTEPDLVCGWDFNKTVEDDSKIPDITGRYNAKLAGNYMWER